MRASELIAKLAEGISFSGDKEVELVIEEHDGYSAFNVRSGAALFVTDRTYENTPFRIVSRRAISTPASTQESATAEEQQS